MRIDSITAADRYQVVVWKPGVVPTAKTSFSRHTETVVTRPELWMAREVARALREVRAGEAGVIEITDLLTMKVVS